VIDVVILRRGLRIDRIVKKLEGGGTEDVSSHRPWFIATKYVPLEGIVDAWEEDVSFYGFNESSWRYEPVARRSWRIEVDFPKRVRWVSERYEDLSIKVSMNNIRYEARVSLDVSDNLFGVKIPLPMHYSVNELESVAKEILGKSSRIKVMGFDIEVRAEGSFPKPGEEVFLVSACWGSIGGDEEECTVLEGSDVFSFLDLVKSIDPHYIVGFNSAAFDIPYLTAYIDELKSVFSPSGIVDRSFVVPHIDAMEILDRHGSAFGLPFSARMSLDDVAAKLGLASKEELEVEGSLDRNKIYLEYKSNRAKVVKYSEVDARLTYRLGKLIVRTLLQLYALTGISPSIIQLLPSLGSLSEYTVLDYLYRIKRKVLECRWARYTARELEDGYGFYKEGTKIYVPGTGFFKNVAYYDFNMLYPSIYNEYRLDPTSVEVGKGFKIYLVPRESDSKRMRDAIEVVGVCSGGDVYEILSYFYNARKVSKKLKKEGYKEIDMAVKILVNSAYGMFSKARGCGVNEFISGFIFFKANQIFQSVRGYLKNRGMRVIYGDTDSFFVELKEGIDPEKLADEITRIAMARFGPSFSVKLETLCRVMAILQRKTYVCLSDDEVIIKGMERLEIPVVMRENMEDLVRVAIERGSWKEYAYKLMVNAPMRDLFVKASKRMTELFDEDENRFKNPNSNRTKAVIVKYLVDQGIDVSRHRVLSFHFTRSQLDDVTVIAHYVRHGRIHGKNAISVYLDDDGSRAKVLRCSLIESRASSDELSGRFVCIPIELSREQVIELALSTMKSFVKYLDTLCKMSRTRVLTQWATA